MCGIGGIVNTNNSKIDPNIIENIKSRDHTENMLINWINLNFFCCFPSSGPVKLIGEALAAHVAACSMAPLGKPTRKPKNNWLLLIHLIDNEKLYTNN